MPFDHKFFEALLVQELGDRSNLTPQELYELGTIYQLKYPGVMRVDFTELVGFLLQFGFVTLDRRQALAALEVYWLAKALGLRTSRGKRVAFKEFCLDLLKAADKAIFNLQRDYRLISDEIQLQDSENLKTLDELLIRKDKLDAEILDMKAEKGFHLKRKAELLTKEAELKRSFKTLVDENRRASTDLALLDGLRFYGRRTLILKARLEILENDCSASQAKEGDQQKLLASLTRSLEELPKELHARKEIRAKLLASVNGQTGLSTKLDRLRLDIEALERDNLTLEFELQERRCMKSADTSDTNSFTGFGPHFNLKEELERSTPELHKAPPTTPTQTWRQPSSVIGARKRSGKPHPKPLILNPNAAASDRFLKERITKSNLGSLHYAYRSVLVEEELTEVQKTIEARRVARYASAKNRALCPMADPRHGSLDPIWEVAGGAWINAAISQSDYVRRLFFHSGFGAGPTLAASSWLTFQKGFRFPY
ncbi:hypothetical protein L0F63_004689 [Massospora cicadina]|nr:hypothetical protein L0F63_004689 [Massospora cicadina]